VMLDLSFSHGTHTLIVLMAAHTDKSDLVYR